MAQPVKNLPAMQEMEPWVGKKDTLRRKWQCSPVSLPEESCGQRSLEGQSRLGRKKSEMTEATKHTKQINFQLDSPRKKNRGCKIINERGDIITGTTVVQRIMRDTFEHYETQAGIKIAGRNLNNLRDADDTTLMAKSKEELKSLLMKVKRGE